ncbi:AraC family transcriptional regulator [Alicyclobacillus fastidiosus]|uniref:AraC family transcriptional regulator n=1 Tax=Alicyclobacillus fastidiosus TaxID=392011 RepID=A0ABV5AK28_9BACL|nr:AraC family transcriptional regulator [Alicyclobacillus fastidiosus]WEH11019.1 AraC family transcriptional regulator [Alicyclobacillus fastidiosus]
MDDQARIRIPVGRLCQLTPTVNFANRMQTVPGQTWGPRIIPDCQLLYVVTGSAVLHLGCDTLFLSAGDCVFYGSANPHKIVSSEADPFSFTSIHYSWQSDSLTAVHPVTGIRDCHGDELLAVPSSYAIDVDDYGEVEFPHYCSIPHLEEQFMRIVDEYRSPSMEHGMMLRALLIQLLLSIIRHHIQHVRQQDGKHRVAPALDAIRQSPQKHWSVHQLATLCGYHPTYFAALFRDVMGRSPKQYQMLERIQRAKEMLLITDTTQEAAEALGYSSVHYFCRNFKTVTGITPGQFKRQSREV